MTRKDNLNHKTLHLLCYSLTSTTSDNIYKAENWSENIATVDIYIIKAALRCAERKGHAIKSMSADVGIDRTRMKTRCVCTDESSCAPL